MYVEGLRNDKILSDGAEEIVQPPRQPEFGKPQQLGSQAVDPTKLSSRTVKLTTVNWGPPE